VGLNCCAVPFPGKNHKINFRCASQIRLLVVGSVYFPAKLSTVYQASQNLGVNHLETVCRQIPEATRAQLLLLKERKPCISSRGTKKYWATAAEKSGLIEKETGLAFSSSSNTLTNDIDIT